MSVNTNDVKQFVTVCGLRSDTKHSSFILFSMNAGWGFKVTTVSQKNVPPSQLAIIFTYTVRLRQFLAQLLPRK